MQPLYLDYNATTPIAPAVLDAMLPWLHTDYGNPSSSHPHGLRARAALDLAREQVAAAIGAHADEVVFTGGGTEANNLAILGTCLDAVAPHLVTSTIEHPATSPPHPVARKPRGQGHPGSA